MDPRIPDPAEHFGVPDGPGAVGEASVAARDDHAAADGHGDSKNSRRGSGRQFVPSIHVSSVGSLGAINSSDEDGRGTWGLPL